jgi:hypothetical protein
MSQQEQETKVSGSPATAASAPVVIPVPEAPPIFPTGNIEAAIADGIQAGLAMRGRHRMRGDSPAGDDTINPGDVGSAAEKSIHSQKLGRYGESQILADAHSAGMDAGGGREINNHPPLVGGVIGGRYNGSKTLTDAQAAGMDKGGGNVINPDEPASDDTIQAAPADVSAAETATKVPIISKVYEFLKSAILDGNLVSRAMRGK